jgi:hypothetical protein
MLQYTIHCDYHLIITIALEQLISNIKYLSNGISNIKYHLAVAAILCQSVNYKTVYYQWL